MDFRGRGGNQVLRPGVGQGANRPGAGQRPAQRPARDNGHRVDAPVQGNAHRAGGTPGNGHQEDDVPLNGLRDVDAAADRPSPALAVAEPRPARRSAGAEAWAAAAAVGFRGGGGGRGGGGRGGGGRRSDIALKHDIVLLGHLENGLGFYRFSYNGSDRAYVGVMAQEVQAVMPKAVVRDRDGSLRVFYEKLGIKFQTYEQWIAAGARMPKAIRVSP